MVECAGFENRSARKGSGSSNLPLSVAFDPAVANTAGVVVYASTDHRPNPNRLGFDPVALLVARRGIFIRIFSLTMTPWQCQ